MRVRKTLVGPRLRQLRRDHGQTQAEMAKALGVSTAYVNLLENWSIISWASIAATAIRLRT